MPVPVPVRPALRLVAKYVGVSSPNYGSNDL
jgi:hypothetical protein